MGYQKIDLFGTHKSRGTFDDFFSTEKYDSVEKAYEANDYVEADFVRDDDFVIYIEAKNVKNPEVKKYHRLNFQNCPAGLDILDDQMGALISVSLL